MLIYNNSLQKHKGYIKIIIEHLQVVGFYFDIITYKFYIIKILYLRFIISTKRVKIYLTKIKSIINWPQLKNLKDI